MRPETGDALIIVDLQHDFLPDGSLGVPNGDQVIPVMNRYIKLFRALDLPILATRDWHPEGHCSFESEGGTWPVGTFFDACAVGGSVSADLSL